MQLSDSCLCLSACCESNCPAQGRTLLSCPEILLVQPLTPKRSTNTGGTSPSPPEVKMVDVLRVLNSCGPKERRARKHHAQYVVGCSRAWRHRQQSLVCEGFAMFYTRWLTECMDTGICTRSNSQTAHSLPYRYRAPFRCPHGPAHPLPPVAAPTGPHPSAPAGCAW